MLASDILFYHDFVCLTALLCMGCCANYCLKGAKCCIVFPIPLETKCTFVC